MSREPTEASSLCFMGRPNYAEFGDRIHAIQTNVCTEDGHAGGADDSLVDVGQEELMAT